MYVRALVLQKVKKTTNYPLTIEDEISIKTLRTYKPEPHWTNDYIDSTAAQRLNGRTAHVITDRKRKTKTYVRQLSPKSYTNLGNLQKIT